MRDQDQLILEKLTETIIKEAYFVRNAKAFFLYGMKIIKCEYYSHYESIIEYFDDLESDINDAFESEFGEPIDMDDDHDVDWFNETLKDFMIEMNIFPIVVDLSDKTVYIRPVNDVKPSPRQIKAVKDWSIEQGYGEVKVDFAVQ